MKAGWKTWRKKRTMTKLVKEPVIKFEAIVSQVRTLADGGVRVVLDLPESAIPQMAMLAQTKIDGIVLDVEVRAKT